MAKILVMVSAKNYAIMIVYLSKSHVAVKCGEIDASAREVLLRSVFKTRFFSFITFKINKVLNIS